MKATFLWGWCLSRFVHGVFFFVLLHLSFLVSAGPLSTVSLFLRLTVPLDPSPDLVLQPFQHLPTHSKSCKRKLTFVSPHLIRGLDHYIRRDSYFPIFCLWRGVSLTGIKCLQSTAFFGTFFVSDFVWQEGEGESMLKITSLRWGNEKDYWRWFNYNPSSCCCFNSISFLSHI